MEICRRAFIETYFGKKANSTKYRKKRKTTKATASNYAAGTSGAATSENKNPLKPRKKSYKANPFKLRTAKPKDRARSLLPCSHFLETASGAIPRAGNSRRRRANPCSNWYLTRQRASFRSGQKIQRCAGDFEKARCNPLRIQARSERRSRSYWRKPFWRGAPPPLSNYTKNSDTWDFEIVVRDTENCNINGCVLASAFFPDGGRHTLTVYPTMFDQAREEQVETMCHEIGHNLRTSAFSRSSQ